MSVEVVDIVIGVIGMSSIIALLLLCVSGIVTNRKHNVKVERTPPEYAFAFPVGGNPTLFIRDNIALRKYCFNQTNKRLPIDERLADAEKIYNYLSKHTEPWQEQRK